MCESEWVWRSSTARGVVSVVAWIAILTLTESGCSGAPAQATMRTAIEQCLKQEIPVTWRGSLMPAAATLIDEITIEKVGEFEDDHGVVRARVIGQCDVRNMNFALPPTTKRFDCRGEFQLHKNQIGEWSASITIADTGPVCAGPEVTPAPNERSPTMTPTRSPQVIASDLSSCDSTERSRAAFAVSQMSLEQIAASQEVLHAVVTGCLSGAREFEELWLLWKPFAVRGIGGTRARAGVLLGCPRVEVRRMAARVLGEMGRYGISSLPVLQKATSDADAGVRDAAAEAVAAIREVVDAVPEDEAKTRETFQRLDKLNWALVGYLQVHHTVPKASDIESFCRAIEDGQTRLPRTDAWGTEFVYQELPDGVSRIRSLGADRSLSADNQCGRNAPGEDFVLEEGTRRGCKGPWLPELP